MSLRETEDTRAVRTTSAPATSECEGGCQREPFVLPSGCPPITKPSFPTQLPACTLTSLVVTKFKPKPIELPCPLEVPTLQLSGAICGTFSKDDEQCRLKLELKVPNIRGTCGVAVMTESDSHDPEACANKTLVLSAKTVKVSPKLKYTCGATAGFTDVVTTRGCELDHALTLKIPKPPKLELAVTQTCGGEPTAVTTAISCGSKVTLRIPRPTRFEFEVSQACGLTATVEQQSFSCGKRIHVKIPKPETLKFTMVQTCCITDGIVVTLPDACEKEVQIRLKKPPQLKVEVINTCGVPNTKWLECLSAPECGKRLVLSIPKPERLEFTMLETCCIKPTVFAEPLDYGRRIHVHIPRPVTPTFTFVETCTATRFGYTSTFPPCSCSEKTKTVNYTRFDGFTRMAVAETKVTCCPATHTYVEISEKHVPKTVLTSTMLQYQECVCTKPTLKLVLPKRQIIKVAEVCGGSPTVARGDGGCTSVIKLPKQQVKLKANIAETNTVAVSLSGATLCSLSAGVIFDKTLKIKIPKQFKFGGVKNVCDDGTRGLRTKVSAGASVIELNRFDAFLTASLVFVNSTDLADAHFSGPARCDLADGTILNKTLKLKIPKCSANFSDYTRGIVGYDVNFNVSSGVFSKTPIIGLRAKDQGDQVAQDVFVAVDEEI